MNTLQSDHPEDIHSFLWHSNQLARGRVSTVDTGYANLSQELPGGGWAVGALIEVLTQHPASGEMRLLAPALAALQAQKAMTFLAEADGPVFVNLTTRKRFTGPPQIWKVWQTALKRAGVRYRRPYQTHHTYASMMLSAGEHRCGWRTRWGTRTGQ
ncbi:hypothetical protein [Paraburkholderia diazotrophica]|uniref:hypothetical protein n=1 Tax=Paraburkholderia diazotrophica TaxID=667676 RepID=UPI003170C215